MIEFKDSKPAPTYSPRQSIEDVRWLETLSALESVKEGKTVPEKEAYAWIESWGSSSEND